MLPSFMLLYRCGQRLTTLYSVVQVLSAQLNYFVAFMAT
jgi:hypothetical protein